MRTLLYLSIAPLLVACTGQYYPLKDMTAEQIRAAVSPKEATMTCITGTYAGAKATTVIVNADRGVPAGVKVDENCVVQFDTKPQPAPSVPLQVPSMRIVPQVEK